MRGVDKSSPFRYNLLGSPGTWLLFAPQVCLYGRPFR
jgi:hypothetical protein